MGLLASVSSAIFDRPVAVTRAAPSYYGAATSYLAGPLTLDAFNAKPGPSPTQLVEQYKSLIFACVQLNALGVSRTPLRLYSDASKGGGRAKSVSGPRSITSTRYDHLVRSGYLARRPPKAEVEEITDHPLVDMLDSPDPEGYFSRHDLIALMVSYCDVVGVGYAKLDPPGETRPPSYCWPLQAQHVVDSRRSGTPLIERYTYFADTYAPRDVLRFRVTLSLRDPYGRGYSPTYAALQYAQLEDKYVAIQDQLLAMGPRPSIMVSSKDASLPMGEKERQRFQQDLARKHYSGETSGVMVTDGAVDVKPLSYSPTDLSGMELSQYDLERVCNVFGVPISYFTKDTNLANLEAADAQHARTAIEPRCKALAGTLTRLAQRYDDRLFFAFDPAVEEDKERDARISQIRLDCGLTTINEERTETQWEEVPWGDEPWLSSTLQQPTMITATHEQGLETAKAGVEAVKSEAAQSADSDGDGDGDGGGARSADHAGAAVDTGPRLDAILASIEESLGL